VELHDGPLERHVILVEVLGGDLAAAGFSALRPVLRFSILQPKQKGAMTISIKDLFSTLSITKLCHCAECRILLSLWRRWLCCAGNTKGGSLTALD